MNCYFFSIRSRLVLSLDCLGSVSVNGSRGSGTDCVYDIDILVVTVKAVMMPRVEVRF